MKSWNQPEVPRLPGAGEVPRVWNTASGSLVDATPDGTARLYVCGITPYDTTHLGHAATYLAFDTLVRLWRDAGFTVEYVQNSTDVDDPLLQRARETGVDWRELAAEQTELFRRDMEALRVIPPDHYVAVTERIAQVADAVERLLESGAAYVVENDVYFDIAAASSTLWQLGAESRYDRETMLRYSAERGGDPQRPGKRDPLDPLLWRAERPGEPSWPSPLGPGRPGWHIECAVIAEEFLSPPLTVNGGGGDLIFPHHEFSAGHAAALTGVPLASAFVHTGMVAYHGEKMSKSLGNLVRVSELRADNGDARAIRLVVLAQHYRSDWEYTEELLAHARHRLEVWAHWATRVTGAEHPDAPTVLTSAMRAAMADDLHTDTALEIVDSAVASGRAPERGDLDAIDALLGIRL
ncbi:cysteine--1-D-myo-inosityl 2-amino-2-deoxy-alpha-D-glucopyranoside ligase [Galbitalea soli]|uniref:L-cysteine:1D-myo-inositol 2-amino-2-deoxy-alpha-D-glucopyranoside ligase n=1 Tax=Galbitalea soli TaxID=1268042 RepID=A0A7C9TPE2_9MICO|nr:cysteine--1-D-myo-inosityl 2-amino-2-deoxy-alpha-D-glucopyranoside ligase [Galbitalea soli]NYJ30767.1 L-cysteine:1D-myo-inositol 2-amino-2-deoxy-alpha-D-glucopyranoside ligase [Galbitalea soli]